MPSGGPGLALFKFWMHSDSKFLGRMHEIPKKLSENEVNMRILGLMLKMEADLEGTEESGWF